MRPDFTHFSGIFIVDFEQGNTGEEILQISKFGIFNFFIECSSTGPGLVNAGNDGMIQSFSVSVKESVLLYLFQTFLFEIIHYFKVFFRRIQKLLLEAL